MCFNNNEDQLARLRKGAKPIKAWKRVSRNIKTGALTTTPPYNVYVRNRVPTEWAVGKISKPHVVVKPLSHAEEAGAGLYFYTSASAIISSSCPDDQATITATVKPKDIIGANYNGSIICCTAAKVVTAPKFDLKAAEIKWLKCNLKKANALIDYRERQRKDWEAETDDYHEALGQMKERLAQLIG